MLSIKNLHESIEDKPILKGLDLEVKAVEAQKLISISLEGSVG